MNKIFERICFSVCHTLVIFLIALNVPLLKSLTSASVNHLLETPSLFTGYIMKSKKVIFLVCIYCIKKNTSNFSKKYIGIIRMHANYFKK